MNKIVHIGIITVFLFSGLSAYGEVTLFLKRQVGPEKKLNVGMISGFDGKNSDITIMAGIVLPKALYRDGYIDRRELTLFLRKNCNTSFRIIGSAVKVRHKKRNSIETEYIIKRGDTVKLIVVKKGITIHAYGKAQKAGRKGDKIPVRIKKKKIQGQVMDGKTVRLEL